MAPKLGAKGPGPMGQGIWARAHGPGPWAHHCTSGRAKAVCQIGRQVFVLEQITKEAHIKETKT